MLNASNVVTWFRTSTGTSWRCAASRCVQDNVSPSQEQEVTGLIKTNKSRKSAMKVIGVDMVVVVVGMQAWPILRLRESGKMHFLITA